MGLLAEHVFLQGEKQGEAVLLRVQSNWNYAIVEPIESLGEPEL